MAIIPVRVYSQRDWRWRWSKFGFGGGTFGSYGCTTVALTSLLFTLGYDLTPPQVAERLRKVKAYTGDLLIWGRVQLAFPKVKFVWRNYAYKNAPVKEAVEKGMPVMVEVLLNGHRHWVLFLGDQKMMDPWNGRVISTATYPLIGYALFTKA